MKIGNKIMELRKRNNFSQEELAEKVGVARQTISKWELGETSPDIKQAKLLSEIFNVSLDELVNNDIKDILIEKTTNTEKLAGMIIKILKVIGVIFIVFLVIDIIAFVLFTAVRKQPESSEVKEVTLTCSIVENDYIITIGSDAYFNCSNCDKKMQVYLRDITDLANIDTSVKNIEKYFEDNGGTCK